MKQIEIDAACREIYAKTNMVYDRYKAQLGSAALGFKILYGPPHAKPPILFIGDQPGGRINEDFKNERDSWFPQCEYASEAWPLAANMQRMFGSQLLLRCVGINSNFFRAPTATDWKCVPVPVRGPLEAHSREQLARLIDLLEPAEIVVIGFSTLDKFGPTTTRLVGSNNRVLMKSGNLLRRPAVATLHLSGAQISREDRLRIAEAVKANCLRV